MKGLLTWWEGLCTSSKVLRFVDVNLRGIGQVMFQDNPLTGLLFFVAIGWGSYAAGMPQVAIGGLVAVVAATLTAQWLRVDAADLGAGLYGYNAYLVGLALGDVPRRLAAAVGLRRARRRRVGRGHARHRQRVQDLGRGRAHRAVRAHDVAAAARHLCVLRDSRAADCRWSARSCRSIRRRRTRSRSATSSRGSSRASRRCS